MTTMLNLTIGDIHELLRKPGVWLSACMACLLISTYVDGLWQPVTAAEELAVTASFVGKNTVTPDEPVELTLSRPLAAAEGRPAVLVGATDLTGLFAAQGLSLKYSSGALPLPAGETVMTVYVVTLDEEWREIARFPLRVVARRASRPDAAAAPAAETPQA